MGDALTRYELLTWRNIALATRSDLWFGLSVLTVILAAAVSIYQLDGWLVSRPIVATICAIVIGFGLYGMFYYAPNGHQRANLISGPLYPWAGFGPDLENWCRLRALTLTMASLALISVPVGMAHIWHVPALLVMAGLGAIVRYICLPFLDGGTRGRLPFRLPTVRLTRPTIIPVSLWIGGTVAMRRKIGPIPALYAILLFWCLSALACGLSASNNNDNRISIIGVNIAGLLCGIALTWPDLGLLRFLAFQPAKASRILVALTALRICLAGVMSLLAGVIAGLSAVPALLSFCFVFTTLLIWLALLHAYGLTKSEGGAVGFAIRDVVLGILVKTAFLSSGLALAWIGGIILFNYLKLDRRRWREPG
ncbi:hypothetical protein [Asticcacaulis sp. 201]|uniref:hypothetical protein n=1 Tax=Asticcacaulis sp. 201 TaxID=3028787 RepID=UPI00291635E5|nr:hypothetical protein [Asticcacaulis sp. 201]MDV6331876.1 hypothetical protein [Asticcacaulis sp. 201]